VNFDALDIRAAQAGDLDAITHIEAESFKTNWLGRERLESRVAKGDVQVAETSVGIVGFCVVLFSQDRRIAVLDTIAVMASAAGKGIGTALLISAEQEAVRRGLISMRLDVRANSTRAVSFYLRSGFRKSFRVGKKVRTYSDGVPAMRMHKRITGKNFGAFGRALKRITGTLALLLQRC
jgi:ribosomal protein S18 acetylase RimI-like enzyme